MFDEYRLYSYCNDIWSRSTGTPKISGRLSAFMKDGELVDGVKYALTLPFNEDYQPVS